MDGSAILFAVQPGGALARTKRLPRQACARGSDEMALSLDQRRSHPLRAASEWPQESPYQPPCPPRTWLKPCPACRTCRTNCASRGRTLPDDPPRRNRPRADRTRTDPLHRSPARFTRLGFFMADRQVPAIRTRTLDMPIPISAPSRVPGAFPAWAAFPGRRPSARGSRRPWRSR